MRTAAPRHPKPRTSRDDVSAALACVEPIDDVDHGPAPTDVKYRRVIAELLALAVAQCPSRVRPRLGAGDPLGHLRARFGPEPAEDAEAG